MRAPSYRYVYFCQLNSYHTEISIFRCGASVCVYRAPRPNLSAQCVTVFVWRVFGNERACVFCCESDYNICVLYVLGLGMFLFDVVVFVWLIEKNIWSPNRTNLIRVLFSLCVCECVCVCVDETEIFLFVILMDLSGAECDRESVSVCLNRVWKRSNF